MDCSVITGIVCGAAVATFGLHRHPLKAAKSLPLMLSGRRRGSLKTSSRRPGSLFTCTPCRATAVATGAAGGTGGCRARAAGAGNP